MRIDVSLPGLMALRMRLRFGDRAVSITRRHELNEGIHQGMCHWRTQTGRGIPPRAGTEARHAKRRVVTARHVEERGGIVAFRLTSMVERLIDKAQVISGFLVGNRQEACPLRRT